jgi:two-component system sensor histidine kinase TctE
VDLTEVAAQVIQRHLPTATERDVDLGYSGLPGPVLVFGNETLLGELLSNLVDNALRYGRRCGVVTVRIAHKGRAVVLEVIDDGPGLGALSLDTVFNRFQRGDVTADSGAGLGLAIVKEIAERHSATVSCDAPSSGGFRVVVAFPEIEPRAVATRAAPPAAASHDGFSRSEHRSAAG